MSFKVVLTEVMACSKEIPDSSGSLYSDSLILNSLISHLPVSFLLLSSGLALLVPDSSGPGSLMTVSLISGSSGLTALNQDFPEGIVHVS